MVFIPSDALHDELLRSPQFVRMVLADGKSPALLIKSTSLSLKYLIQSGNIRLVAFEIPPWMAYAIRIDDGGPPAFVWSFLETGEEREALRLALSRGACMAHLFTEVVVNVASAAAKLSTESDGDSLILGSDLHPSDDNASRRRVEQALDDLALQRGTGPPHHWVGADDVKWTSNTNTLITGRLDVAPLDLLDRDEGGQQERMALWLTDHLDPGHVLINPRVRTATSERELCDILLSYDNGPFLIESKALGVLSREALPTRIKLTSDTEKHVGKAVGQLGGALRALRAGAPITDRHRNPVDIDRRNPAHAIVLVPDLSLISDVGSKKVLELIERFAREGRDYLQILDLNALLRTAQAAAMLAKAGRKTTPMMAFDAWLLERWKVVMLQQAIDVDLILRIETQ